MQRTPTVPWLNAASMLTITSSLTKKKKKKKRVCALAGRPITTCSLLCVT